MAAKKMILISQEKYDRLMSQAPLPVEKIEPKPVGSPVGSKSKAVASKSKGAGRKRKAQPPPPGEPASKLARRVLKFKRY